VEFFGEFNDFGKVHDSSDESKEASAVKYFLIETEVILFVGYISISLMKPSNENGKILGAFEKTLF
jgi:hypothetical protein